MPAPFCKLSAGFGSINLFFFSSSQILAFFLLNFTVFRCFFYFTYLAAPIQYFFLLFYLATMGPRLMTRSRSCPDEMRCFSYPQFLVAFLFLHVVFILLFFQRRTISQKFFDTQSPSIFAEELVLSHHARCVLSRFRCNGQSFLLNTRIFRQGRIEIRSCSTCSHPTQDSSHLTLSRLFTGSLHRLLFGDSFSICDFWFRS